MFDLQIWIPILALAVAAYGVYLQYVQVGLMKPSATTEGAISASPKWWRSPIIATLAILALLAWVPFAVSSWKASRVHPPTVGVMGWGALAINDQDMTLHVNAVISVADPTSKLFAIAFHYRGDTDVLDAKNLQKSALYDLRVGNQVLIIKPDDSFRHDGMHPTNYELFVVPNTLDPQQFQTARQLFSLGGKLIWGGVGPP
jgi:hypothetical protein